MVTGDDIAKADSLLQQIKDKEHYIYNDLLKGQNGCEKEIATVHDDIWQMIRYPYPLPIVYDYKITGNAPIPDPFANGILHDGPAINNSMLYPTIVQTFLKYDRSHSLPALAGVPGMMFVDYSGFDILPHFDGQENTFNALQVNTPGSFCQHVAERSQLTTSGVIYAPCKRFGSDFTNLFIGAVRLKTIDSRYGYNITTFEKTLKIY